MANTGVAPATAPSRAIVGPCVTSLGFQYWYLACLPEAIVAVPQGIWTGLMLAMSNSVAPRLGLVQALVVMLASKRGQTLRASIEPMLQNMPDSRLRSKPNTVILTNQLRSITFKRSKFAAAGALITPDIILETRNGKKQTYGIQNPDFDRACEQLLQMYPQLVKTV
jgi:hypothetical protein